MRILLTLVLFLLVYNVSRAQQQPVKYYCPPCNCSKDVMLFDKPGVCPDPVCSMELLPVAGEYQERKVKTWSTFLRSNWLLKVYDILILPAVIQGVIFSLLLVFRRNGSRLASWFLAALIFALSLQNIKFYYILNLLINYILNKGGNPDYGIQFFAFPVSGVLFIGPSLYFYVRCLTSSEFRFRPGYILHFIPGLVFIIINAVGFIIAGGIAAPPHAAVVSFFTTISSTENFLAIGLSFYYIFLSVRLIHKHELWVYQHFSTTSSKSLKWLRNFVISLSLVWVVWLFAVVINFFTRDFILTYLSSYPFQIFTSVIIFWIGYVGFIQGEIFSAEISFEKKIDDLNTVSPKPPETRNEVKEALLHAMETDKLFLVPDLTLAMLSHRLSISPRIISQTLNNDLNKNFHDFVNEYRIAEVKKRLPDPQYDHLTILAIAIDSGFNSKSSFNRIFIKATGVSPKAFKEACRK